MDMCQVCAQVCIRIAVDRLNQIQGTERRLEMRTHKRVNPFASIYTDCNAGDSAAKLSNLPDFPRILDLEMTNACNFRCLMCPTGNLSMKRKTGFMDETIFNKVLAEIRPKKTALRFIRWGEPLLHPKTVDFISMAHGAGILTHINTNGSQLNEEVIQALVDSGLDSIKFSFQGVDSETYAEMRNTDYFEELLARIALFWKIRGNRERPYISASTTITYESKDLTRRFLERIEPIVDQVSIGRTVLSGFFDPAAVRLSPEKTAVIRNLIRMESVVRVHPQCPEVFDKMSIDWDGSVTACCGDYDRIMTIGSVLSDSLQDIWLSERMDYYRRMLADMRHDELDLCKICWDYHGIQNPGLQDTV